MTTTIRTATGNQSLELSVPHARAVADRAGIAITWDAWAIAVPAADFHAAVRQHCPAFAQHIPSTSAPREALTRAMARNQSGTTKDASMRWERVVIADPLHAVCELAVGDRRDHFSAAGTLRVTVDLATGALTHTTPANNDERMALDGLVHRYGLERASLTASDITGPNGWLRKVLADLGAIKMSTTQAQFLVLASKDGALEGVEQALAVAGVALIPLAVTAGAARGAASGIARTLAGEAASLLDAAQAKLVKARAGSKRIDTSGSDVVAMRAHLTLLQTVLGVEAAEAARTLDAVTATLRECEAAIGESENAAARAMLEALGVVAPA